MRNGNGAYNCSSCVSLYAGCQTTDIKHTVVSGSSVGFQFDCGNFSLVSVVIRNSLQGIDLGTYAAEQYVEVINCTLAGNQYGIISRYSMGVLELTNSTLIGNEYGIYGWCALMMDLKISRVKFVQHAKNTLWLECHGGALRGYFRIQQTQIESSLFDNSLINFVSGPYNVSLKSTTLLVSNFTLAPCCDDWFHTLLNIVDCTLEKSNINYVKPVAFGYEKIMYVSNTTFDSSQLLMIGDIIGWTSSAATVVIEHCVFSNINSTSAALFITHNSGQPSSNADVNILVKDCLFENITGTSCIDFRWPAGYHLNLAISIIDSLFQNNAGTSCITLELGTNLGTINVTSNVFQDNNMQSVILVGGQGSDKVVAITENYFANPLSSYELYVKGISDTWNSEVSANNNWWGSCEGMFVTSRIYDFYDDVTLWSVNLDTIYNNPWRNQSVPVDWNNWSVFNETIGGRLTQNETLWLADVNSSFAVGRSIFIPFGLTLIIYGPVSLTFDKTGIYIEGNKINISFNFLSHGKHVESSS
jgi:hypothetical protein